MAWLVELSWLFKHCLLIPSWLLAVIVGLIAIFAVTALFVKRYVLLDIFEYISSRVYLKNKPQLLVLCRYQERREQERAPKPSFQLRHAFSIIISCCRLVLVFKLGYWPWLCWWSRYAGRGCLNRHRNLRPSSDILYMLAVSSFGFNNTMPCRQVAARTSPSRWHEQAK
jgi:hypothetical protein